MLRSGRTPDAGKPRGVQPAERGQVLILWILVATVILVIGAIVIDVGLWMSERRKVQLAADFAALAAASELAEPGGDPRGRAEEFARRNGFEHGTNGVTVEVITPYESDEAKVEVKIKESSSGGLTRIFGAAGFDIGARAVGTLGSGEAGPLDAAMILDHTGSMCADSSNPCSGPGLVHMNNAKTAAKAALQIFDPSLQHIALGVIPASDPSRCPHAPSGEWIAVPLSDNYRDSNGNLDSSSTLVSKIDCLTPCTNCGGTNLGDPVRRAREVLLSARPNTKKAIILLTDGAANEPRGTAAVQQTGFRDCATQVPGASGDNNGFEVDPSGACGDGGLFAQDVDSGTNTNTDCGNSGKDRHLFGDFNISVPAGSIIEGIEVQLDAWADSSSNSPRMCVQLSWDGGNSWTSAVRMNNNLSTSESSRRLGGSSNNWGHTWTPNELSNTNLRLLVTNTSSNAGRDFFLDRVAVQVTYDDGGGPRMPCNYANQQAAAAKSVDVEVITIGFGIGTARCDNDTVGPYQRAPVPELLADMATLSDNDKPTCDEENLDRDHYYCEASGESLTPVFQRIAEDLTQGYRLDE